MSAQEGEEKATILVVEDDVEMAWMIGNLVEQAGYSVVVAQNGEEALDMLGLGEPPHPEPPVQPDLILLDVLMEGLDGYEVCKRLRQDERLERLDYIPIIMVTVLDSLVDEVNGLELGADDYIAKPFRSEELVARIRALLRVKRLQDALRVSEKRYRSLFDGVPVGLYRTTPAGQILEANLIMVQMLGYPDRESLLRVNATDLYVNLEDRRRWQALLESEGVVHDFEAQLGRHDGTAIWVRDSARVDRDANGRVLYYEGSLENITKRKQAEEALRDSEARFRALVESSSEHIFMLDHDGTYLFSNNRVDQFGLESGESLVGRHLRDVYPPEVAESYHQQLEQVLDTGQAVDFEHPMPEPDGDRYHLDTLYPIRRDGEVWAVGGICRDITERKRIEEMKDTLVRDVSHELKTPLAKMDMSVQLLMKAVRATSIDRQKVARFSEVVAGNVQKLQRTVEGILDLSSLESGRTTYHKTKLQLENLISQVVLDMRPVARAKGLKLVAELPEEVPQVEGDLEKLLRVLTNLVDNSVKYTDRGKIIISAQKKGHEVEIAVSDPGRGILEENLDGIFERSYEERPGISGAGIGLTICKTIVEAHDGKIWAESAGRGQGTTVRFTLPIV